MNLLSTKILSKDLKAKLEGHGISVTEYDAISIKFIPFEMPKNIENAIFTSQNGVRAFLSKVNTIKSIENLHCFCVGEKTKCLLEENGLKVKKMVKNASELANYVSNNYKKASFYFFSGNLKSEEIVSLNKVGKMMIIDQIVYETSLNYQKFDDYYQKILFFSPSGVQSYTRLNQLKNSEAYCIGLTTATEAKKHTSTIQISDTTTIESLVDKVMV